MTELSLNSRQILDTAVAMAILATITVFLRLLAKKCTKTGLKADDVWILLGLASFWAYVGVIIWGKYAPLAVGSNLN